MRVPKIWDIHTRCGLKGKGRVIYSPGKSAKGLPAEIIVKMLDGLYTDSELRLSKIQDWFKERDGLTYEQCNDLFFGCGLMMMMNHTIKTEKNVFKALRSISNIELNEKINSTLKKLINLLSKDKNQLYRVNLLRISAIKKKFIKDSLLESYYSHKTVFKDIIGQDIEFACPPRIKYPKIILEIAKYLVRVLENSEICKCNRRYKEERDVVTNKKLAAETLVKFAELFGVILPKNLRNRI